MLSGFHAANRIVWSIEMQRGGLRNFASELPQRRDVVENVERSSVRGDHEIVIFHGDVRDLRVGKIERQRLPVVAIIKRNVDAMLGARIQKSRAFGIFAHSVNVVVAANAVDDLLPRLAVVAGLVDVRRAIVLQIILHRNIRGSGFVLIGRCFDQADAREIRHSRRRNVGPILPAVASDEDKSVIRTSPNRIEFTSAMARSRRSWRKLRVRSYRA